MRERFQELLELLTESAAENGLYNEALDSLGDQFFGQLRMVPAGSFAFPGGLDQLDLDTVVENRAHPLCRIVDDGPGAAIEFPGHSVGGPSRIASALRFIGGVRRFVVRALPDELNSQAKIVLVRRLVREGLLAIVADPAPHSSFSADGMASGADELSESPTVVWETPEPARQVHEPATNGQN
jgi:hypothetical protein